MPTRKKQRVTEEKTAIAGFEVSLVRKKVKRVSIRILPPFGEIRVTAPFSLPIDEIERLLISHKKWIAEKIAEYSKNPGKERCYGEGEYLLWFGKRFQIISIESGGTDRIEALKKKLSLVPFEDGHIYVPGKDRNEREKVVWDFYRMQTMQEAERVLMPLANLCGVKPVRITVRRMKSRWGVCNRTRNYITLSSTLAQFPKQYLSFVLVHELLHLRFPNHGEGFHREFDRLMPENRRLSKELTLLSRKSADAWVQME